ncbi:MAG TPA: response regulator [Nitrososphaeraceae archaeon]|nr:response regulator [Nitrososphaeraceae archaeon]
MIQTNRLREEEFTQQEEFSSADADEVIKRILVMDDNPDITLTFKKVLQGPQIDDLTGERHLEANITKGEKKVSFEVITYNDPFLALSEFKPNFYHLMLVDINMPKMNGFEFSAKILERDANPRICFMSSGQINQEALKEVYPTLSIGCFIKKPIMVRDLIRRIKTELECLN